MYRCHCQTEAEPLGFGSLEVTIVVLFCLTCAILHMFSDEDLISHCPSALVPGFSISHTGISRLQQA